VPARNVRRDARPVASVAIAHVAAALWRDALLSLVMDASAAHFGQTLMMLVRLIFVAEAVDSNGPDRQSAAN